MQSLLAMAEKVAHCEACTARLVLAAEVAAAGATAAALVAIRGAVVEVQRCEHEGARKGPRPVDRPPGYVSPVLVKFREQMAEEDRIRKEWGTM